MEARRPDFGPDRPSGWIGILGFRVGKLNADKNQVWNTETRWRFAVYGTAIFATVLIFVCFLLVFFMPKDIIGTPVERARTFTPFIGVLIAGVTFCSIVWRGVIQNMQVAQQQIQNSHNEEGQLVNLLEKAIEHLSDNEISKISLGIALLEQVALAKNGKFAPYSLELVARQLPKILIADEDWGRSTYEQWKDVLVTAGQQFNREPKRIINFDLREIFNKFSSHFPGLDMFEYFPASQVRGAYIGVFPEITCALNRNSTKWIFIDCRFSEISEDDEHPARLDINRSHFSCSFDHVQINFVKFERDKIAREYAGAGDVVTFKDCDFTGAIFDLPDDLAFCSFDNCFYRADSPPRFGEQGDHEIEVYLKKHKFDLRPH